MLLNLGSPSNVPDGHSELPAAQGAADRGSHRLLLAVVWIVGILVVAACGSVVVRNVTGMLFGITHPAAELPQPHPSR